MRARPRAARRLALCLGVVGAAWTTVGGAAEPQPDPLGFFAPTVMFSAAERAALDRGGVVSRGFGANSDMGFVTAIATTATTDQFVALASDIRRFKDSPLVRGVAPIGAPPALADFADLPVHQDDVDDLHGCRPGACGVKLTTSEIVSMRGAIGLAGRDWRARVPVVLRALLRDRAAAYEAGGLGALPPPDDGRGAGPPQQVFDALARQHVYLRKDFADLVTFIERGGPAPASVVKQYLYWSSEDAGSKLVTTGTHLTVVRVPSAPGAMRPLAMTLGKQVFATHYYNGSFNVLSLCGSADGARYLVTVNISRLDLLGGHFKGMIRGAIERRVSGAAPEVLRDLARRMETVAVTGALPRLRADAAGARGGLAGNVPRYDRQR